MTVEEADECIRNFIGGKGDDCSTAYDALGKLVDMANAYLDVMKTLQSCHTDSLPDSVFEVREKYTSWTFTPDSDGDYGTLQF